MASSIGRIAALQAAFFVTASTYVAYGISIVVGAIVARSLGPTDYGEYAYVVFLTGLLVSLANHGLNTSGIRFVSECLGRNRPDQAARVHKWLSVRQVLSIIVVLGAFAVWAIWLPVKQWRMELTLFVGVIVVCVYTKARYIFDVSIGKGHGNFRIEPYTTTYSSILSGAAALVLAWRHAPVDSFIYLFVLTSVGIYLCGSWMMRRAGIKPESGAPDADVLKDLRAHLFWTAVLAISIVLGTRSIETYLLASKFGPEQVAYYTIAGGLMRGSADLLTVGLGAVLLPAMARAFGAGGVERVRPIFSDSLRYLTFLGLLLAGGGALWADPVVRLIYGTKYLAAIPVLQAMLICMGVSLSEATTGTLLTTTGRQRARAWIVVGNLVLAATLAFWLVPRYGLVGATLSYVIGRVTYSIVVGIHALYSTGTRLPGARLLRLLVSAGLGLAVAWGIVRLLPGTAGWLISGVAYGLVITLASVLLRAWTPHDVDLAIQVGGRAPGVLARVLPLLQLWRRRFTH
ncbi:MAG TPA: oligosaccharide flippase family protein [Steroidobacteraceae bacterium]|nr:oligosaccharide flippase family protein [Steroidobacteraceae bacterium]